jgi:hypothetical protein
MKTKKGNGVTEITNTTDDKGLFKAFIPLVQKNGTFVIEKSNGDGQPNSYYLVGEASNTKIDKADDRMSKNFIKSMRKQMIGLNVFAEHEHDIEKTLGYVSNTDGNDDMVVVETALENPLENTLVDKILKKINHGTKIFYSVAGKITKAYKKVDETINKTVREIEDGIIYEVSLTALPEGDVSFVAPIMKSFDLFMKDSDANDPDEDEDETDETDEEFENDPDEDETDEEFEDDIIEDVSKISKALKEMIQSNDINEQIYNMFYAFRSAIYDITNNSDLTPEEKKNKIMSLAGEYAEQIEMLSSELATLAQTIDEQLNSGETE